MSESQNRSGSVPGPTESIARVRVDVSVMHLDRDFDYAVPEADLAAAVPGARVRVRFSGRLRDAYVVARVAESDVSAPKAIERVIDSIPPLTDETLELVEQTARRFVGSFWDVVRAAVPARHARAEKTVLAAPLPESEGISAPSTGVWDGYQWPQESSEPRRLVWSSAPATDFACEIVDLIKRERQRGRGVVVVVPDAADLERLQTLITAEGGKSDLAVLSAEQGPERRYREFLRARTGHARIVIGTRNAVFAPVHELGAVIVWDDGDDVYREPHAPYWDAREVAALRSHLTGCNLYVGGPARSVSTQWWCQTGWARSIEPIRPKWWQVQTIDDTQVARDPAARAARIPSAAWQLAHESLTDGPVLFQVLRRGYVPVLACQKCRTPAVCSKSECLGPLQVTSGHAIPSCSRCGSLAGSWECPNCHETRVRSVSVGAGRTAEELGRAFPGVPVIWSEASRIVRDVSNSSAIVVATAGAEPRAQGGYRAVVLLDATYASPTLSGPEQQVRRWFGAARLVGDGGRVCVVAESDSPAVQALVRYDSRWFAERQIAERTPVGLPPVSRAAELTGPSAGVSAFVSGFDFAHRVLGPVPVVDDSRQQLVRSYVLAPRSLGNRFTEELNAAVRRASTGNGPMREVRVRVDPRDM